MLRSIMTLFTIAVLVAAASPLAAQESSTSGPKMVIPEKIIDLGNVAQGDVLDANYKIVNEGSETLVIKAVRPTCGCTVAEFDREVPAGGTGWIRSKLDTRDYAGPISKAILVMTNDPETSAVNLIIKANIRPFVEVLPRPLVTFNTLQNEGSSQTLVVSPIEADESFNVTKVAGGGDLIAVTVRRLEGDELLKGHAPQQFELELKVKNDAPVGPINQKLTVHTTHGKAKEIPIKVFGVVRTVLQISPPQIQFGSVEAKAGPGRYIMIADNRLNPSLDITSAKVDDPAFDAKVVMVEEGKRFQVTVTVKPDAATGSRDAKLVLTTNDESHAQVSVPVRANLR